MTLNHWVESSSLSGVTKINGEDLIKIFTILFIFMAATALVEARRPHFGKVDKKNVVGFRVSDTAVQNLNDYAERMGKTRNDVINELLEGLV